MPARVLELQRAALLIIMFAIGGHGLGNTTSFDFTFRPYPSNLAVGFTTPERRGLTACFGAQQSNQTLMFSSVVSTTLIDGNADICGAINVTVTQVVTTVVNETTVSIETRHPTDLYVEVLLLDPLLMETTPDTSSPASVNMSTLMTNQTAVERFAEFYSHGSDRTGVSGDWASVKSVYENRTYYGPLQATNFILQLDRFLPTSGLSTLAVTSSFPMQVVLLLPVKAMLQATATHNVSHVDSSLSTFFIAATPFFVSGADVATELQGEVFPRGSFSTNFSTQLNDSAVLSRSLVVDFVMSNAESAAPRYRSVVRLDADWSTSGALTKMQDVFSLTPASLQKLTSVVAVSDAVYPSDPVGEAFVRTPTATDMPFRSTTVRCFGLRSRTVLGNSTRETAIMRQKTALGSAVVDCVALSLRSALALSSSETSLTACRQQGSVLFPGYYVCSSELLQQANTSQFVLPMFPALVSTVANNSGSLGGQHVNASALQRNATLALRAVIGASTPSGQFTEQSTSILNVTRLFLMSTSFSYSVSSAPYGNTSRAQLSVTPTDCFSSVVIQFVPMKSAGVGATLRPFGASSGTPATSVVMASLAQTFSCDWVALSSSVLLQSTPLDGYCGAPWSIGLAAFMVQEGLLIAFHRSPFAVQSTLYTTRNLTLQPQTTCCTTIEPSDASSTNCSSTAAGENLISVLGQREFNVTIRAQAFRCSYDVFGVKRNCSAAVGAYLQLVLLPAETADTLMRNRNELQSYVNATPSAVDLSGFPLVVVDTSGTATFSSAGPLGCFNTTMIMAPMFPFSGASDATHVITDGAVQSYYRGISLLEMSSLLYVRVRPSSHLCFANVRTKFLTAIVGLPLGPLDTDMQDSCGTLLSGSFAAQLEEDLDSSAAAGVVHIPTSSAPLSTTLAGVLTRTTDVSSNNTREWRATFTDVVPTNNLSTRAAQRVRIGMRMSSSSVAAIGDIVLTSDVSDVAFLSRLFLNNCSNPSGSWLRATAPAVDRSARPLSDLCGSTTVSMPLSAPAQPLVIDVELATSPQLLLARHFADDGVWLNLTFPVNCFDPSIATLSQLRDKFSYESNLKAVRAPRAFLFTVGQDHVVYANPVALERRTNGSSFSTNNELVVAYQLPVFVKPNSLFNNYNEEVVTMRWSPSLLSSRCTVRHNKHYVSFTIFPNKRPVLDQAVSWLALITMAERFVRISHLSALQLASSCQTDYGDHLELSLHPLSFAIGSDDATSFLVGAVVSNAALVVFAHFANFCKDALFSQQRRRSSIGRSVTIDADDTDALKGFPSFPNWGLRMWWLVYPGLVVCGARAISLGLNTFLLYTVLLILVIFGVGYPVVLSIVQRIFRPRFYENEALISKESVQAPTAIVKGRSRSARAALLAAKASAEKAVHETQAAVEGFFAKAVTPTGFYEINHTDHVRFLSSYQDYRGDSMVMVVADSAFSLLFAVAAAFPCTSNQVASIAAVGIHALLLLGLRPYLTIARLLFNVLVDFGCVVAITLSTRKREIEGHLTLQFVFLAASFLNVLSLIWSAWRSEKLRKFVRRHRRVNRRKDRFKGLGERYESTLTRALKAVELHLYRLHSVKPEVVHRRNLRSRKLMLDDGLVVESSSGSPTDEEELGSVADRSSQRGSSPSLSGRPKSPDVASSASLVPKLSALNLDGGELGSTQGSPQRLTSVAFRSAVSDDDSEGEEPVIHEDAPEALSESRQVLRQFATSNRFKPYIRNEDGKVFGRSDGESVVKRLVISADGVREVRDWREGTVQLANEEIRKRDKMEEDFKKLSAPAGQWNSMKRTVRGRVKGDALNEQSLQQWEEAFTYEIARSHGVDRVRGDAVISEQKRETLLERRQRIKGERGEQFEEFVGL